MIEIVAFASLFVGCATEVRKLPITYVPQQNVQAIKGADTVPVEVKVEDLQADQSQSAWDVLNPVEQRTRFGARDAADTVKEAAETELKARGFKIGDGGAIVTIQLGRFEATCEGDQVSMEISSRGSLAMRVQVQPLLGKILYSRTVGGDANPQYAFFWMRKCATRELQGALEDALKRLFADPAFTAAILATRPAPPAKPAVSPGRIAGAYATMSRR